jgi:large subunit ribosomal protein L13
MGTYSAKPADIQRDWLLIDAEGLVLGRLATYVANRLRGKHKAMFTPNMDTGDHVVIVNAEKVVLTGNKRTQKVYYRHTNNPGGLRETRADKVLDGRFPERVIQKAVERMITRGPLGRDVMRKLHVYKGAEHPHQAQQPTAVDFASLNSKNARTAA